MDRRHLRKCSCVLQYLWHSQLVDLDKYPFTFCTLSWKSGHKEQCGKVPIPCGDYHAFPMRYYLRHRN